MQQQGYINNNPGSNYNNINMNYNPYANPYVNYENVFHNDFADRNFARQG